MQAMPVVVQPQIDAKRGLSEPIYAALDVRLGNEGTVTLSVYVLPNGSVGDVRLVQTSGLPHLDASALSEARRWHFKPGMEDGKPVAAKIPCPVAPGCLDGCSGYAL